jgi:hypothetical protein
VSFRRQYRRGIVSHLILGALMTRFARIAFAAAIALAPASAFAGAAEDAFLAKLPGVWKGKGTITGAEKGTVDCILNVRQRSVGVNFSVKCDVTEFGAQSFSGVISYNDAKGQYEAKSGSGEITVGKKSGNAVIFEGKMKGLVVGTSVMKVTTSKVTVDATVRRPDGNSDIKSHLELKR